MKIFFSVGEPSGDIHGANLIRDLKSRQPKYEFLGFGGPRMEAAGCRLRFDLTTLAVMGIIPVLRQIRLFWRLLGELDAFFAQESIDAVVLIDYPGFNWWVARKARRHGIPVFYYGVPQMWGWASWRVRKMRRLVDHALCKLPFEVKWYQERGCAAHYVGHPFFDEVRRQQLDQDWMKSQQNGARLVLLLAGSRTQEIHAHVATMLRSVAVLHEKHRDVRFAFAAVSERHAEWIREQVAESGLPIEVHVGKTPELIRMAYACIACSGSVSLELMAHQVPTIIVYQISRLAWFAQAIARRSKYITLVNLLATDRIERDRWRTYDPDRADAEPVPYPEYLTATDRHEDVARRIDRWLIDPVEHASCVQWLSELYQRYGQAGASERAAEFLIEVLDSRQPAGDELSSSQRPASPESSKPKSPTSEDSRAA